MDGISSIYCLDFYKTFGKVSYGIFMNRIMKANITASVEVQLIE